MDELTTLPIEQFLNQVADRKPTPGGGSVTGVAGALACALARMVAEYSVGPNTVHEHRAPIETALRRLRRLDGIMRALITQDAVTYDAMTAMGKRRRENPAAPNIASAYADAVLAAVAIPMEMAAVASQALAAMDEVKSMANRHLLSDLGIAAVLADATVRASGYTVRINLGQLEDEAQRARVMTELDETLGHAETHRDSIETFVCDRLEGPGTPSR